MKLIKYFVPCASEREKNSPFSTKEDFLDNQLPQKGECKREN